MSKVQLLFVGEFPPPYGGVTVKDSILVNDIFNESDLHVFDLYCFKRERAIFFINAIKLISEIKRADRVAIGVGHPARTCWLFRIAKLIRGKTFLRNITVFMMGTGTPCYLRSHPCYISDLSVGRCIFTESETLNNELLALGCANGRYLPNFRSSVNECEPRDVGKVVRFVYFAQVRPEKGIEVLLDAVKILNNSSLKGEFSLAIYGSIVNGYEDQFRSLLYGLPNVEYKGEFDASQQNVYLELNQYDISVSSSSWNEGMSGSNIESKFAGIASIVSDVGFNAECVKNGVSGLLVKPGDVDSLVSAMAQVIANHPLLFRLKLGSFDSRIEYDAATWKQEVLSTVLD